MAAGLTLYFDTSALLKLYLKEPETEQVKALFAQAMVSCSHLIAYAEMRAGLARAVRTRRIEAAELAHQNACFEADWSSINVIKPDENLIRRAGDLAQQFGLRGYDSVHLAAAEAVWQALPGVDFRFVVFDDKLVEAAQGLGMRAA
jgi:predicted nucleic acid-binding protein